MIFRTEHPKPQFRRENWLNLNGQWQFAVDKGCSGAEKGVFADEISFDRTINVPFCPQSKLSGIAETDFMYSVWYKRTVTLSQEQIREKTYLHFGAVDYKTTVYINGKKCGEHTGGYVSFKFDITEYVKAGVNYICVNAEDDERNRLIPSGKQSRLYRSHDCDYTRTTGIWQTVWLEFTPLTYIEKVKYFPSPSNGSLTLIADVCGAAKFTAEAFFEGKPVGNVSANSNGEQITIVLPLKEKHLWKIGEGGLYDLTLTYGDDTVSSYFGLRSISYRDYKFFLNGESVFQRLVLDQGFYPDGIYTAPSDRELELDIDRSVAMGFNGARLHEKVFEERFLYYADKKGYIVWGEYPNWGLDHSYADAIYGILPEWLEEIERDFNHPAIVGWCPFNETWDIMGRKQCDELISAVYKATKSADPTRPCIDTSGNYHVITDIYDVHNYEQNPKMFAKFFENLKDTDKQHENQYCVNRQRYDGKLPFFVSEYGGIAWAEDESGWGYGKNVKNKEEFFLRLKGLTDALLDNPEIFGLCYTQLTDVEQEQNGLYTYDRKPKFSPKDISPIFSKKAAVEK